jgi:hypothetical protein
MAASVAKAITDFEGYGAARSRALSNCIPGAVFFQQPVKAAGDFEVSRVSQNPRLF